MRVKTQKGRQVSLFAAVALATLMTAGKSQAADKKPNILVIWGDDIGQDNISAYHRGLIGDRTPNIDRDVTSLIPATWCVSLGHKKGPDDERQAVYDRE